MVVLGWCSENGFWAPLKQNLGSVRPWIFIICFFFFLTVDYDQYFVTPYFIFVRDFLNYLLLFGLHVAKCLQPSSLQFTALEWAIMAFFLGRIMMEIKQMFIEESFEKNAIESCGGFFHPKSKRHQKDLARVSKSKNLTKYFGYVIYQYILFYCLINRAVKFRRISGSNSSQKPIK